jgi:hypothetical protein
MYLGIVHRSRGSQRDIEAAETDFQEALPLAAGSEDGEKLGDELLNLAYLLREDQGDVLLPALRMVAARPDRGPQPTCQTLATRRARFMTRFPRPQVENMG